MEKFMEMAKKMEEMSPDERKEMVMKIRGMCTCTQCASYNECMKEKNELAFCATGKSECLVQMKECICPECPVTSMMGLINTSYCMQGSEKELRGFL